MIFTPLVSQVDIRFPQPGSDEPDKVTVTGLPETVDNAIDHLLNLEEEYVSSLNIRMRCSYSTRPAHAAKIPSSAVMNKPVLGKVMKYEMIGFYFNGVA